MKAELLQIKVQGGSIESGAKGRVCVVEICTHPDTLSALTGIQKSQFHG